MDRPRAKKNLAWGVFWQPAAVVADTALLSTLEPSVLLNRMNREYRMIADDALFASIERGEPVTARSILPAVDCKRRLSRSRRARHRRAPATSGHSFGHAPSRKGQRLYAVGHGARRWLRYDVVACRLSERQLGGLCSAETTARLRAVLRAAGTARQAPLSAGDRFRSRYCWTKSAAATFVFCERPGRLLRRMPFDEAARR